jgi:hypothetical protein
VYSKIKFKKENSSVVRSFCIPPCVPNAFKIMTILKLTQRKENWFKISVLSCDAVHSNVGLLVTSANLYQTIRRHIPEDGVDLCMCGCFGNMYPCIECVLYCTYCVFCIVSLCVFILIFSVLL